MAITESFRNAVASNDVMGIRIMMKDSLLVDPTFSEFDEKERFARNVSGLYDSHDSRELNTDTSTWDDSYMNKLMVQVVGNFSRERVEHLKKVVRHLRPETSHTKPAAERTNYRDRTETKTSQTPPRETARAPGSRYEEQKREDERNGRIVPNREIKIAAGAAGGGVVGGIIASAASASVLAGVVIGAVAGGAVIAVVTRGE